MLHRFTPRRGALLAGAALAVTLAAVPAQAQDKAPIKIGFSQSLTGFLSPNGKQALLGAEIWREEINAAGGLLGRPVNSSITTTRAHRRKCRASTRSCSTSTKSTWSSAAMPPTRTRRPCR